MAAAAIWRGFHSGVRQGQPDDPGMYTDYDADLFTPGPWPTTASPWIDGQEDPFAPGLPVDLAGQPNMPVPDVGAEPIVGAYMPYDSGPVTAFGEEAQNVGRVMNFGTNPVLRVDEFGGGVMDGPSYADELASAIAMNGQGQVSEAEYTTNLLLYR